MFNNFRFTLISSITLILTLTGCGTSRWYSVEQEPALPFAYVRDGVFVSGNYVRSATVTELNGETLSSSDNDLPIKISVGLQKIKIHCDEAEGSYDSNSLNGQARVLEFEAQTQRTYRVLCYPYSHWWVEDMENDKIVAGEKPIS